MKRFAMLTWLFAWLPASFLIAAPPTVLFSSIEDGQDDVDPGLTELRVKFDQPMSPGAWSIVGGGPNYPVRADKPRWADRETLVIPIALQPDRQYWLSINSDTHQNFRNPAGEACIPQPIGFKTRPAGPVPVIPPALTLEQNRGAIALLRRAIDDDYSYRDRLGVDWEERFAAHSDAMESAETSNEFARAVVRLLRSAKDGHIYVRHNGRDIGTHFYARTPNYNLASLRRIVPGWTEHPGGIVTGRLDENVGYLLITQWSEAAARSLENVFPTLQNSAALVVDVRPNGGGDEILARHFAGRFVDAPAVYSQNRNRRGGQWTGPFDRIVQPRPPADRYANSVAVLIGPKVGSSCESFVLMMAQSPRCTLIGEVTKGSSGNPRPHDLANGVIVFLPSWEDLDAGGIVLEGKGVEPEVSVKTSPGDFQSGDPVLARALERFK